jgi:hypothetical protein
MSEVTVPEGCPGGNGRPGRVRGPATGRAARVEGLGTAEQQYRATRRVDRADLLPGDLVFFCCNPD